MSNNIKENHIRHVKEAIEDVLDGLKHFDLKALNVAIEPLVVDNMYIVNYDNHQFECAYPSSYSTPAFPNDDYIQAWKCAQLVQELFNHEMYEKNGDVWQDAVDKLLERIYKLI